MESEGSKVLTQGQIYSDFQICDKLKANEKCFRLQRYNEGKFDDLFHEHVPKHRISRDNALEVMKSLVARYSEWTAPHILRSYLNKRGKEPRAIQSFQVQIEYPEPGVLRKYCCGSNVDAWVDEVIAPDMFRCPDDSSKKKLQQPVDGANKTLHMDF